MIKIEELERLLREDRIDEKNAFDVLRSISYIVNRSQDGVDSSVQALVLRVLDRRDKFHGLEDILNALIRHLGLYPYLDSSMLTVKDALARESHRPDVIIERPTGISADNIDVVDDIVFHRVQAEVFRRIISGENIVLSAPTSFGKSALIDALISSAIYRNIVVVVPTIALIDETRRRLAKIKGGYKIITHASQEIKHKNVFILTQERVIEFPGLPSIDLFVLDEFYKLDPREDSHRAMVLNHAFYKLFKMAKQFYLLGPSIQGVPEGFADRFDCHFVRTDYSTVVTELIHVKAKKGDEMGRLLQLCSEIDGPTLIFCASPSRARKIVRTLSEKVCDRKVGMSDAAEWVAANYHPEWTLVKGLRSGVGMHHGRMPRSLAQLCVKGFNEGSLPFLVCTSTLIEGVNTKAKNVVIFDNKIARQKYDYFTFNNIRGRSGRMFKHFVGNVYMFHNPPQECFPEVDVPLFSQDLEKTSDDLLIQIDDHDLKIKSRERVSVYHKQQYLDIDILRQNSGIDPSSQVEFAQDLTDNFLKFRSLAWKRFPNWEQLQYLCELIWKYFGPEAGRVGQVSSGKQLAYKLSQLKRKPLKSIMDDEVRSAEDPDDAIEGVLEFIRSWPQYRFPKLAMGVCRIYNYVAKRLGYDLLADYGYYCAEVENLFSDAALVALDEYGLPFQVAKRLESYLESDGSLDKALHRLKNLRVSELGWLTPFEKELVEDVRCSV